MLVDCHGGRRRRYWCAARDSLVRAMEDHLRHLGRTGEQPLPVERVGTWEVSERTGAKLDESRFLSRVIVNLRAPASQSDMHEELCFHLSNQNC